MLYEKIFLICEILKNNDIYKKIFGEGSRIDFDTRGRALASLDTRQGFATIMQAKVDQADPFRSTEATNSPKSMVLAPTLNFLEHSGDLNEFVSVPF